ncbi:hypothetical protein PLUTO_00060 [Luteibacter phage vB_LflM-Pluto]|uniref:Tail fiber protein n=1 Tax=Luteibacter phage vB_LflM-Pluto TaxID=2948611 RepID=A0A9E7MUF6_9CAUD|nr:hypothetical protein PLUTO_00060 [Luteibacter phage vB_LflM-Pluto]
MAQSILASALGNSGAVFVNELTGTRCWTAIKIVSVEPLSDSSNSDVPLSVEQVTESTVAIGLLSSDIETAKIMRPSRIRIEAICEDISTIESILALFADTTATISVTSKSIIANSMAVTNAIAVQDSEMLSASRVFIELEQVDPTQAASFNPLSSSDASNYGLSVQAPITVGSALRQIGSQIGTTLNNAGSAVVGLYNRIQANIGAAT